MTAERGRWLWRVDALLWIIGVLVVAVMVVEEVRSGRPLASVWRSVWTDSSGLLLALAAIVTIKVIVRWRASREEADIPPKYPTREP